MTVITTKYSEGDTVFWATTTMERHQHDCPDCLGERKWQTTSPAGTDYTFACPRCSAHYHNHTDLSLNYQAHAPRAERRTIGSVQVNTALGDWNSGARYMCVETGIGSGTVYEEARLFETEAEALAFSAAEAEKLNANTPHLVKQYDAALKVSDYQLSNAELELARKKRSDAGSLLCNLESLQNAIIDLTTLEEAQDYFAEYMSQDWEADKTDAGKVV